MLFILAWLAALFLPVSADRRRLHFLMCVWFYSLPRRRSPGPAARSARIHAPRTRTLHIFVIELSRSQLIPAGNKCRQRSPAVH